MSCEILMIIPQTSLSSCLGYTKPCSLDQMKGHFYLYRGNCSKAERPTVKNVFFAFPFLSPLSSSFHSFMRWYASNQIQGPVHKDLATKLHTQPTDHLWTWQDTPEADRAIARALNTWTPCTADTPHLQTILFCVNTSRYTMFSLGRKSVALV